MRSQKSVHELAEEVGGMYALVVAAAKRAKQLREGRQPVTKTQSANPLTIALQELLEGKIIVRPPGEKDETDSEPVVVEAPNEETQAEAAGGKETAEAGEADDEEASDEDEDDAE